MWLKSCRIRTAKRWENFGNKYEKSQETQVKDREYTMEEINRELEKQRRRHAENVGIFGRKET